jgi:hypothetical protein
MNEQEAKGLLDAEIGRLRGLPYGELLELFEVQAFQTLGASGAVYNIELQAFWDDRRSKTNIRVMGSIDDAHGLRLFKPLTSSFIHGPQRVIRWRMTTEA